MWRKYLGRSRFIEWISGFLFASPFIVGFLGFIFYPIASSLYYSLCKYDILTPPRWIGGGNYIKMFIKDEVFWISLYNTMFYTIFALPLSTVASIVIALLLNTKVKALSFFRTVYYLPTLVPAVANSILWVWILNPEYGLLNSMLKLMGVKGPGWLGDPVWAKPSLILMSMWGIGGAMVIYLAGLQDVPVQLYEAADLDGASALHKTLRITLPLLSPVILFNVIMGLIGAFQYFTQAFIMTDGGPAQATLFYALYLYRNAFSFFHMGYASAMAWFLFLVVLVCTLLIFNTSARWVYYGGEQS